MNTKSHLIAGLVLGSAMLVGCEERPEARPAPDRTTPTSPTTPTTPPGAQDAQSRAQTLILQFHQQVDSGDYQSAERTLQQLEGMKSSLPKATQDQLVQLRDALKQRQGSTTPTTPPRTPEPAMPPGS